jgi:cell wall-associated NlpC family hydrolase
VTPVVAPLRQLHEADMIVVAQHSLPASVTTSIRRLPGVTATASLDAARIQVNGTIIAMIGVDPSSFRAFAARPTASSNRLWQNVAAGGIAVSYDMGKQDHLSLHGSVHVTGRSAVDLPVAGFATAGIGGIDAVVSHQTAAVAGLPAANAIVVSAPKADMTALAGQIRRIAPARTAVQPLVYTVMVGGTATGGSGIAGGAAIGASLTRAEVTTMLSAALSRQGMPYVWGANGPRSFDCSGLVQWSFAQAGIAMPRVAADQARTGPLIPASQAQPGDLLFWRTDPTAPNYISHVAIYLGNGQMIQAPQPGQNVEVVPAVFGSGFAGVVQVRPQVAVTIAG